MSAQVEPCAWAWWCAEFGDGSELTFDTSVAATKEANEHDRRNHRRDGATT